MGYRVKLDNFEGPLDLLLFFIQRDQLNIYDIPIAPITNEFLEYIKTMELLNIELGGEFILMAATLMKIKARMLLPILEEEEVSIDDPRTPLVQRLLEYQQFKETGERLHEKYMDHSMYYPRGMPIDFKDQKEDLGVYRQQVTLFQLSSIFMEMINRLPNTNLYELHQEQIQLEEQIEYLRQQIQSSHRLSFSQLASTLKTRLRLVVTFMAILEMLRNQEIKVEQKNPFGEIILMRQTV